MSRIVVTGGAGFLPSHTIDLLIQRGEEVVALDNEVTGTWDNLARHRDNASIVCVTHDVTEPFDVDGRIDAVMHMASPASPADYMRLPIETLKVGSFGTHNALDLAHRKGAKFILASTSEVYGDPLLHPQPESYWGNVNPNGPRSMYDEAKRYAEATTMAYRRTLAVDTRIVRTFNTYGERMRLNDGRVVSNFITQALRHEPLTVYGDGSQTRSFCYVADQAAGYLAVLDSDYGDPVNIGNDAEFTMLELADLVIAMTDSRSPIQHFDLPVDDPLQRKPDLTVARTHIGWAPSVTLENGLERTIAYFRSLI